MAAIGAYDDLLDVDGERVDPDEILQMTARSLMRMLDHAQAAGARAGQDSGLTAGFNVGYALNGGPVAKRRQIVRDADGVMTQIVEEPLLKRTT